MKKEDIYDEGECWFDDPARYGIPGESPLTGITAIGCIVAFIFILLKFGGV